MGLRAIIAKVTTTAVDAFLTITSEIYPGFSKESRSICPPGFEGVPMEGDQGVVVKIGSQGKTGFMGVFPISELEQGEARMYARDPEGNITAEIMAMDGAIIIDVNGTQVWVTDGEIALGEENPSDNLALASKCKSNDDALKDALSNHITWDGTHTHVSPVGPTGPPVPPAPVGATVSDVKSDLITAK